MDTTDPLESVGALTLIRFYQDNIYSILYITSSKLHSKLGLIPIYSDMLFNLYNFITVIYVYSSVWTIHTTNPLESVGALTLIRLYEDNIYTIQYTTSSELAG